MVTLDQLEADLAERLAALDATAWQQGGVAEVWAEAPVPLTAVPDSVLRRHLSFSVSVEGTTVVGGEGASGELLTVLAELRVVYVYRVRPAAQRADYRAAIRAGRQLLSSMLAPYASAGIDALIPWRPGPIVDGWLTCESTYTAILDLPIIGEGG